MQSTKGGRVREMWETHTIEEIAAEIGTTGSTVSRLAACLGLESKASLAEKQKCPSEDEIKARAAEVRAKWTPSEERRRRGQTEEWYTVPCLTNAQVFPAFQGQGPRR